LSRVPCFSRVVPVSGVAMRIEDLKRWHWIVLGLAVGLGISYWRGSIDAEMALRGYDSLDVAAFERNLTATSRDGRPLLRNIRVYPAEEGVYWVAAEELPERGGRRRGGWDGWRRNRNQPNADQPAPQAEYNPVMVRTTTPFVPRNNPQAPTNPNYTVVDYLTEMKSQHPGLDFSNRWWDKDPLRSTIWALAGVLVIGGIWPSIINLLIGAGLGHRTEKKESEYDLSRFGKEEPAPVAKAEPTAAELEKLRQLEAELERNLAASGLSAQNLDAPAAGTDVSSAPAEQPLRVLTSGPVESPATDDKPPEDKHYAGEFYPTVTHVKK